MFQISEASFSDSEYLDMFETQLFGNTPVSYKQILLNYDQNNYLIYVAKYNNQNIGYISGLLVCDDLNILNLGIDEKYRNRGFGYQLLNYLIENKRKIKLTNIFVELRKTNTLAFNLYLKQGFKVYSERKNYYSNPNEDAILMNLLC
ncbi:MAG: ribosomal-protein-alanine N-acetyltransferase [Chloroflexi bacterium]|nr:ribosomal-protein-alanine N-acetyltransferase [Chloroflexota bacterium]